VRCWNCCPTQDDDDLRFYSTASTAQNPVGVVPQTYFSFPDNPLMVMNSSTPPPFFHSK
jgi:hypothetical protein